MEWTPEAGSNKSKNEWALPDLLKRGVLAGIGALFMTEEGVRSILGELKLPKEAAQFVVNQVAKTKEDLFRMISEEIRRFLESINLAEEIQRVMATTSLQISTTVRFVADKEDSFKPEIESKIKLKSKRKKTKKASVARPNQTDD